MHRAGFALPAALLAVVLMAALIAGAFSATIEETKIGSVAAARQLALLSAESAIEDAVTALAATPYDSIGIGETSSRTVAGLTVPAVVYITRLDSTLYWLVAQTGGNPSSPGVAKRIGVVVQATNRSGYSITIDRIPERSWSDLF
jgi:Tfp pilus assembly protein PilX